MPGHVHDLITQRIMAALEAGTVPWQKPWGAARGRPRSMSTGRAYTGVNVMLLGMTAAERGYGSPWWGTFKQIQALGGQVMKGQNQKEGKGSTTVLWAETREHPTDEIDPETGEAKVARYAVTRSFQVFNAAQCEGLPERFYPQPGTEEVLPEPKAVLDGYFGAGGPLLRHVPGDQAYYQAAPDRITLPLRTQFRSPAHYYATAFHEAAHSTGHPARLNRPGIAEFDHFGSGQYAEEELVAQMGSAFLLAETGLDDEGLFDNSAAYVHSWLGALANDRRLVVFAASQAQAAVDRIIEPSRQAEPAAEFGQDQPKPRLSHRQTELEMGG